MFYSKLYKKNVVFKGPQHGNKIQDGQPDASTNEGTSQANLQPVDKQENLSPSMKTTAQGTRTSKKGERSSKFITIDNEGNNVQLRLKP